MLDLSPPLMLASAGLAACGLIAAALLKAWQDWLEVKRIELAFGRQQKAASPDLATLKSRVRRLEAIASGIEL
jgi:hypothetical protein